MSALAPLLDSLIDYAGLFPPAKLTMPDAVWAYARYLTGPDRSLLGRFIVPLARLGEFESAYAQLPGEQTRGWRLSVIGGPDSAADWDVIHAFNSRHADARIVSVETKAATAAEVLRAVSSLPPIVEAWVELAPNSPELASLLAAVRSTGRGAKLRTGGVTPEAFPAARDVVNFLRACHDAGVMLKATAGLHHPLRGEFRLTYEANAPSGRMFGFLNVFLTATLIHTGGIEADALALLEESEARAFNVTPEFVAWRGHRFTADQLAATRKNFCRSFGSCSFTEPLEGLRQNSWL
ncbi:MAG: hypothetical protein C0518_10635 [Opitutus sp.]|nr:hypothetical protein [Opitutus sp.]